MELDGLPSTVMLICSRLSFIVS